MELILSKHYNKYHMNLEGFLSVDRFNVGQYVTIGTETFTILAIDKITCKFYVPTGIMRITCGDHSIYSMNHINRFIKSIGLQTKDDFLKCFFKNCKIIDNFAIIDLHYNHFVNNRLFFVG